MVDKDIVAVHVALSDGGKDAVQLGRLPSC
jgi:hypothetical protein